MLVTSHSCFSQILLIRTLKGLYKVTILGVLTILSWFNVVEVKNLLFKQNANETKKDISIFK